MVQCSSVASFLVFVRGGGGGARPPNVPTQIIYVLILRERAAPQKHLFSGLKLHLHNYTMLNDYISTLLQENGGTLQ